MTQQFELILRDEVLRISKLGWERSGKILTVTVGRKTYGLSSYVQNNLLCSDGENNWREA